MGSGGGAYGAQCVEGAAADASDRESAAGGEEGVKWDPKRRPRPPTGKANFLPLHSLGVGAPRIRY
jgi:hypothetical protein